MDEAPLGKAMVVTDALTVIAARRPQLPVPPPTVQQEGQEEIWTNTGTTSAR